MIKSVRNRASAHLVPQHVTEGLSLGPAVEAQGSMHRLGSCAQSLQINNTRAVAAADNTVRIIVRKCKLQPTVLINSRSMVRVRAVSIQIASLEGLQSDWHAPPQQTTACGGGICP